MKILIGTHNHGKLAEFKKLLKDFDAQTVSLQDLNIADDVEETGKTFEENALLKARFFCQLANMPTLADDGGLAIDALNGEPGVKSRRWKGYRMTDQEMVDYALERLQGVAKEERTVHLPVVLALVYPDGREYTSRSTIDGIITEKQMTDIIPGYPFRSIFYIPQFNKMYSELTDEEHLQVAQRPKALEKLFSQID